MAEEPTENGSPCIFGYGECIIRRAMDEERKNVVMTMKAMPIQLNLEDVPQEMIQSLNAFLNAMVSSMSQLLQTVGALRDLGPFCAACPKAHEAKMKICKESSDKP